MCVYMRSTSLYVCVPAHVSSSCTAHTPSSTGHILFRLAWCLGFFSQWELPLPHFQSQGFGWADLPHPPPRPSRAGLLLGLLGKASFCGGANPGDGKPAVPELGHGQGRVCPRTRSAQKAELDTHPASLGLRALGAVRSLFRLSQCEPDLCNSQRSETTGIHFWSQYVFEYESND